MEQLSPTAYLVLGLITREGPSTPYALKRHVAATLGHFWSFPHTQLYEEPARLADLGLLSERREQDGRRRRVFAVTQAGRDALRAWLERPSREPTELRDFGLLQLFFADLGPPQARPAIAGEQLAIHKAKLADYEEDARVESEVPGTARGNRSAERWRGETLRMGILYERAAVEFWTAVATSADRARADGVDGAAARARAEDDGTRV